jgi:phage gpG-like protein
MLATLEGADALDRRFAGIPASLLIKLEAKARDLATALAAKVRDDKLSGQVLQTRSGALKASIAADVSVDGANLTATVGSFGDVKYAAIQEYGGRTGAHEILPTKAQALAFVVGGATRFARRVQHPGSTIPAHAYLLASLGEQRDAIFAELTQTANDAWSA